MHIVETEKPEVAQTELELFWLATETGFVKLASGGTVRVRID